MATKKTTATEERPGFLKHYDFDITITFSNDLLGMLPNNKEIMRDYIVSKSPDAMSKEDEVASIGVTQYLEKGITVFPRDRDGNPGLFDYHWLGFFAEKCGYLRRFDDTLSAGFTAYKKEIHGGIFLADRFNPIILPEGFDIETFTHIVRTKPPTGPQINTPTTSELIPIGSKTTITVQVMAKTYIDLVKEWIMYGFKSGTGQWRNGGYGTFIADFGEVTEGWWTYPEVQSKINHRIDEEVAIRRIEKQLAKEEAMKNS